MKNPAPGRPRCSAPSNGYSESVKVSPGIRLMDWPFVAVAVRREPFFHARPFSRRLIASWTRITRAALASSLAFTRLAPRHVRVVLANPTDILANRARHCVSFPLDCHENASAAFAVHALSDAQLGRKQGWIPFRLPMTLRTQYLPHAGRYNGHLNVHLRRQVVASPNRHVQFSAHLSRTVRHGLPATRLSGPC